MYERLFTNESVCRRFEVASKNNTSQIYKPMVGLVEMNRHRETPAVISDALFMTIKSIITIPKYDLDLVIIKRASEITAGVSRWLFTSTNPTIC